MIRSCEVVPVLLVLATAACGRVAFDLREDAAVDVLEDGAADASTLVRCSASSTAPATVTVTGRTFRYTNFDNTWAPVPSTQVTAKRVTDGTTIGDITSDSNGDYAVAIATGGQAAPVVLAFDPGGAFLVTDALVDLPLTDDLVAPALTTNDVYSLGDGPVWDAGAMQAIYTQVTLTRSTQAGTLNLAVRDCAGNPVDGITVELQPPSELLRYQAPDGSASATLTSTGPPFSHALAFNSPAGPTRVIARDQGIVVADQLVDVAGGTSYTMATIRVRY